MKKKIKAEKKIDKENKKLDNILKNNNLKKALERHTHRLDLTYTQIKQKLQFFSS